jgi:hypothetical protein
MLIVAFSAEIPAQTSASSSGPSSTQILPLTAVKEGMRGVAKTVFRGSTPEDFGVDILGILPGAIGPQQDLIIGRLNGGPADRTAVFAGMSGSPVYIDGKLIGAISYSFPFSKEPICGITPIEQMVAIFEKSQTTKAASIEPRALSFAELASTIWSPEKFAPAVAGSAIRDSKLASIAGGSLQPIATPLTFSGISQTALDAFAPQLMNAGLLPVASAGGAAKLTPLKPADQNTLNGGASVSMELARGDYSIAASGTVTLRDGNKIYAFGHPFLSLGTSDLPMSESHVVTVVPNLNNSFKMAVSDSMVGSMTQDRSTGVYGQLGQAPKMIPVKIDLETSRGQQKTLSFEVVNDDFLTPLLLNIAIYNSLLANERGMGDSTIEINGAINIVGGADAISINRRVVGGQAAQSAAGLIAIPVSALLRSKFDDAPIAGINLKIRSIDGAKVASLERLAVDKTQVRAGDSVEVEAYARTVGGKLFVERIPVTIPADTPAGALSIVIGDGGAIQQNAAIQQFVPKNIAELVTTLNRLKMPDRLYLQATRTTSGAVIGVDEMPDLPPSVLATLNSDRSVGGYKPSIQSVITEQELPPAEYVINGQQKLDIQVIR